MAVPEKRGLKIGDSSDLHVWEQVTVIGYPNYQKGDSPYGPITGKYVLYRGEDMVLENGITYRNVEDSLLDL